MIIRSLKIQNFKSWKNAFLEFDPGLNVIIGATDSGKSAIVQALKLDIFNKPRGNQFLSWWGGKTLIEMVLNNSDEITRIKGEGKNLYLLNGEKFTAFSQNVVPNEIQNALNFSSINFKYQADEFFLLNQTSGQVAQYINKIVKLTDIDIAQSNIIRKIKKETQKLEFHQSQKEELEIQLKEFAWIEKFEKELIKIENLDEEINNLQTIYYDLTSIIVDIKTAFERKNDIEKKLRIKSKVDQALDFNRQLEKLEEKYDGLVNFIESIKFTENKINTLGDLKSKRKGLKKIEILFDQITKLKSTQNKLDNLLFEIKTTKRDKDKLWESLKGMKDKFNKMSPSKCPFCGQEMKYN
jgi:exonuclease SbcC